MVTAVQSLDVDTSFCLWEAAEPSGEGLMSVTALHSLGELILMRRILAVAALTLHCRARRR